jgi:hypothetical protein
LPILWKRRAEKKTFTAEEDLEEAIRTARYESFLTLDPLVDGPMGHLQSPQKL